MNGAVGMGARVVIALGMMVGSAAAAPALDKQPFTATAAELLVAAKGASSDSSDVVVLREDDDVSYDERGRVTSSWRLVFVVKTQAGADDWNTLSSTWLPAYQDRPTVRVRVIEPSGRTSEVDQKLIRDVPVGNAAQAAAGDRRRLEVPLPPLSVGAVVEEQVVTVDREPALGIGSGFAVNLSSSVVPQSVRARFSAPAKQKLRVRPVGLAKGTKPTITRAGGRQIITYALAALPQHEYEAFVPGDARPYPYITATPIASWNPIARRYRALVEKSIAEGRITLPAGLPSGATLATARALVDWLHAHVEYSGVALGDAAIAPATPAETVKRGWGDAKDMATLLLALFRQAGIRAELALINVGPGPDLDRDLPSFSFFDHVIVRAHLGKAETWIDPVEALTAPGQLPTSDRGRLALIVADDARALIATPAARATANAVREVRTFELAEYGAARVTEVSREGGVFEAEQRAWIRDSTADEVRKGLTRYATTEYKGTLDRYTTTAPDDLAKPFETTVVVRSARRGYTERESVEVYLFPTDVLAKLPALLSDPDDDEHRRTYDLELAAPHSYEIENRLVVPVGFTLPPPAAPRTHQLGPWQLVESQRVDGHTFVVTFRFETTRSRLTPAEVENVQQAARALAREEARHLVFPLASLALADAGTYRDAIAAAHKLISLHPKEALHHQQLAHVLIKAGLGEAARRAARRAVQLEPKNADAYAVLGWVLQHDSFGAWLGYDHDHAGARKALEKAHALDPKHLGAAADLAALLERNAAGRRFDTGSDVRAAIAAWRDAYALDATQDHAYSLVTALLWAGDAAEAEKLLRTMKVEDRRDQLLVTAVAISHGVPAAVREARTLANGASATKQLSVAASLLFFLRHYDLMRPLFAELGSAQQTALRAEILKQVTRHDAPFKRGKDPRDAAIAMVLGAIRPAHATGVYWDAAVRDDMQEQQRKAKAALTRNELMTSPLMEDVLRSILKLTVEGEGGLWRVELDELTVRSQTYVAADRGTPKVIADVGAPQGAGRHLLRLLAKGDEKQALRLLDWLAKDLAPRAGQDLVARRFSTVWGTNLPRRRKDMELAAARLTVEIYAAHAIPILARCKPTTTAGQFACDSALAELYEVTRKWVDLEDQARAWLGRAPKQLSLPTVMLGYALAHQGRFDDADRLLGDALAKDPDDFSLAMTYADVAIGRGKLAEAVRRFGPVVKQASPPPIAFNNLAWLELVEGSDLKGAGAMARKAVQLAPTDAHALNTLATIEAELGELGDAHTHLDASVRANDLPRPGDADLYVHGRMLELLGYRDDAIAVYRRIKREPTSGFVADVFELATARLKALGVKKR